MKIVNQAGNICTPVPGEIARLEGCTSHRLAVLIVLVGAARSRGAYSRLPGLREFPAGWDRSREELVDAVEWLAGVGAIEVERDDAGWVAGYRFLVDLPWGEAVTEDA